MCPYWTPNWAIVDFADVTLAIDDTYGDDFRHGDGGGGHGGWQGGRWGDDMVVDMDVDKVADMELDFTDTTLAIGDTWDDVGGDVGGGGHGEWVSWQVHLLSCPQTLSEQLKILNIHLWQCIIGGGGTCWKS